MRSDGGKVGLHHDVHPPMRIWKSQNSPSRVCSYADDDQKRDFWRGEDAPLPPPRARSSDSLQVAEGGDEGANVAAVSVSVGVRADLKQLSGVRAALDSSHSSTPTPHATEKVLMSFYLF